MFGIPKFNIRKMQTRLKGRQLERVNYPLVPPVPFSSSATSTETIKKYPRTKKVKPLDTFWFTKEAYEFPPEDDYDTQRYQDDLFNLFLLSQRNKYYFREPKKLRERYSLEQYIQQKAQNTASQFYDTDRVYPFLKDKNGASVDYDDALVLMRDMWGLTEPGDTPWNQNVVLENQWFTLDKDFLEEDYEGEEQYSVIRNYLEKN